MIFALSENRAIWNKDKMFDKYYQDKYKYSLHNLL